MKDPLSASSHVLKGANNLNNTIAIKVAIAIFQIIAILLTFLL